MYGLLKMNLILIRMYRAYKYIWVITIFTVAIYLSITWVNWKLTLVIILFMWANNLENKPDDEP